VRTINQVVDDGTLEIDSVFDIYTGRGSKGYRPDLLLKLVLYEHCRGRTKPTQWHRDLKSDLNVQWLTFGLKTSLKALYRFRDRIAPLINDWNQQVMQLSVSEKLVSGEQASIDGTTVAANANRRKLANLQQVDQRLQQLENALLAADEPTDQDTIAASVLPHPGWMAKSEVGKMEQQVRYRKVRARLVELHADNDKRRSDKRKDKDKVVVSLTDPESVYGRDKLGVFRPLYNVQTASDLATDFVLSYEVFAQHSDSGTLQTLVNQTVKSGFEIKDLLADAGYPVGEDLAFCESLGLTLYAPWQQNSLTAKKQQASRRTIGKDEFSWDAQLDVYVCPEGKELSFSHDSSRQRASGEQIRFQIYQAPGEACVACKLRDNCTKVPEKGRTVRRDPYQEQIDRLKARMETAEAKSLYRKRGQTIERVFADFKEHRNLRIFRGRGLSRARTQLGLTILGHNLRTLAKLRANKELEDEHEIPQKNAA